MRVGLAMAGLVGAVMALGQDAAAQEAALPPAGDLFERYAPMADISGTPVMGLVAPAATASAEQSITARVPSSWAGQTICAQMVSSDGRYDAQRSFAVPADWESGPAKLPFPTRYEAELGGRAVTELGVVVSLGDCSSEPAVDEIVPAAWRSEGLGGSVLLLVNSFRADETYIIVGALGLDIGCVPLDSEQRTAFDTMCPLPATLLEEHDRLEVELNRIRRGTLMGADLFAIDLR
jgi:hypothetical protein